MDLTAKGTFHGGDLAGLRKNLEELADLGVSALWITPVVTNVPGFVTGAGFPDWAYHGYWPDDFTKLAPRFGSEDELRGLVEDCHRRGIRVLLDVVYNHAGYNSSYLSDPKTRLWLRTEDRGTCGQDDLTTCVSGLPDFMTENPEVAEAFGIRPIPTLLMFREGKVVDQQIGAVPQSKLSAMLEQQRSSPASSSRATSSPSAGSPAGT